MTLVPIATLNTFSEAEFADALQPLFESAPPLTALLFAARPFKSYPDLIDAAEAGVNRLAWKDQVQVVNAHPRIGANPVTVSAFSYREQGYEREAAIDPATLDRTYQELDRLNRQYEECFGFRFVVFVNGRSKAEILEVLRHRLQRSEETELSTALAEMFQIARDRLRTL